MIEREQSNKPKEKQEDVFEVGKRKLIKRDIPQALKKKFKREENTQQTWKPQKLSDIAPKTQAKQTVTTKANNFLSSLPKPQHFQLSKPIISQMKNKPKPKPVIDLSNPTQQQIKYDIEDTTFIVKQFVDQAKNVQKQLDDVPQTLIPVPQQFEGQDIKDITQGQLVDANWQQKQKQKQMKLTAVEQLKNTLGTDNNINFLLDQAMRKNQQDQYDVTKKATNFMKMKNRYGW